MLFWDFKATNPPPHAYDFNFHDSKMMNEALSPASSFRIYVFKSFGFNITHLSSS